LNYIENHQQIKLVKKVLADKNEDLTLEGSDRKKVKLNKQQSYKNLERTMSTNIMENDLPLTMKFRNFKALKPKITIGPSTIHRNGLFAVEK
jgi:hypothetical protein